MFAHRDTHPLVIPISTKSIPSSSHLQETYHTHSPFVYAYSKAEATERRSPCCAACFWPGEMHKRRRAQASGVAWGALHRAQLAAQFSQFLTLERKFRLGSLGLSIGKTPRRTYMQDGTECKASPANEKGRRRRGSEEPAKPVASPEGKGIRLAEQSRELRTLDNKTGNVNKDGVSCHSGLTRQVLGRPVSPPVDRHHFSAHDPLQGRAPLAPSPAFVPVPSPPAVPAHAVPSCPARRRAGVADPADVDPAVAAVTAHPGASSASAPAVVDVTGGRVAFAASHLPTTLVPVPAPASLASDAVAARPSRSGTAVPHPTDVDPSRSTVPPRPRSTIPSAPGVVDVVNDPVEPGHELVELVGGRGRALGEEAVD